MLRAGTDSPRTALRLVAVFEGAKGLLAFAGAFGFLSLLHTDVRAFAEKLLEHTHLNPAAHYPQVFLEAASHLQDSRLLLIALGAATYSAVRLVEAYGLFYGRAWAEVLAAASGAIYLPFEIAAIFREATVLHIGLLLANAAIVGVMVNALMRRRKATG